MIRVLIIFFLVLLFSENGFSQFRRSRDRAVETNPTSDLNYANPAEYYLGGIDITGLNILDKNAIISLTGLRVGDKIKVPGDQISGAIRKLWNHGLVGDVTIKIEKIEGDNIFLMIELSERARLTDYYFVGISNSRQGPLKEELTVTRGKIVNEAMIRNTELSVLKYFRKKGFLNTTVKTLKEVDTLNRGGIRLRIDIDLQSKVRINEIKFDGNNQVTAPSLKGQLKKTKEHPRINLHRTIIHEVSSPKKLIAFMGNSYPVSWRETYEFLNHQIKPNVFASSKLIQSDFDDDKKRIVEYYNSQGYRDAEVISDSISRFDKEGIDINIKVFEGRKYYFRNITWTGNFLYSSNTLNKILDINKGDVYNRELIDKKTTFNPKGADISGLYMDDGYLFFRVTPVEVAVEGDSIDMEMRIFEGDQATINRITVSGNTRTNDHVILRELNTVPGQKFRRSDLIRTQQMLSQMGYFDPQK